MKIETVKELRGDGWLVNGSVSVPDDDANRDCQTVKAWLAAGNAPEPADPVPPAPRYLDALEFIDRFADAELAAILDSADIEVRRWVAKAQAVAGRIRLDDEKTERGLDLLIAKGLLASSRKAEILA